MGLDYGTDSVRALLVNARTGAEVAQAVHYYPRWQRGAYCNATKNRFRQHPLDYIEGLETTIKQVLGTTHADHLTADVPCAPPMTDDIIAGDYEYETGWQIMNEFTRRGLAPDEVEMVLLANHAPFTWGPTVEKAVYNSAVLEKVTRMAYPSTTLRPDVPRLKGALLKNTASASTALILIMGSRKNFHY